MSIPQRPYAEAMAHSAGKIAGDSWLDRNTNTELPAISAAEFRSTAEAEFTKEVAHRSNQAALLVEWRQGYDRALAIAAEYAAAPDLDKDRTRADLIAKVTTNAGAVAALMSVMHLLPAGDRQAALATCLTMTGDVGRDLAGLVGDAA